MKKDDIEIIVREYINRLIKDNGKEVMELKEFRELMLEDLNNIIYTKSIDEGDIINKDSRDLLRKWIEKCVDDYEYKVE